jgi:para-nitrobenzyl esterase
MLSRVQPFTPGVAFSDFDPATAGAYHMGDLPYWLGTYEAFNLFRTTRNWTAWDRELSNTMQNVIIAFAKTGNPSVRGADFTPYAGDHETRVDFGDSIKTEPLNTKGMDFLETTPVVATGRGGAGRGGRGAAAGR